MFGTTLYGGRDYVGVVFELVPQPSGTYKEVVLYFFLQNHDCYGPMGRLLLDSGGNLYGAAQGGFLHSIGGVFELSPTGGKYSYTVIYAFPGAANAGQPNSPLNMDWSETILYSFEGSDDGSQPNADLLLDSSGNILGTTFTAGHTGGGTVFKITP